MSETVAPQSPRCEASVWQGNGANQEGSYVLYYTMVLTFCFKMVKGEIRLIIPVLF